MKHLIFNFYNMNRLKYLSVVILIALLAGVFVACKKDKTPDPLAEGKKAGEELCVCLSGYDLTSIENDQALLLALSNCVFGIAGKYQKYFSINLSNYDPANPNPLSVIEFNDEDFQTGFLGTAVICVMKFGQ